MRISITILAADIALANDFIALEVFPDMSLDDVKGIVEAEINVPPSAQRYILNNALVSDTSRSLTELGIKDEDIISLAIQTKPPPTSRRSAGQPSAQLPSQQQMSQEERDDLDAETTRIQALENEQSRRNLVEKLPELAEMINDAPRFRQRYREIMKMHREAVAERQLLSEQLEADPFNIDLQRRVEEIIKQDRIVENFQKARDENPESFGQVKMLYINVEVNGTPIKAFVDSGAQTTIMSPSAAERCNIMRLVDKRWSGIARGVGTAVIIGRVHQAEIRMGPFTTKTSFTVMEGKDVDLLLGLDMLKRYQMCIDLKENCLRIDEHKIPFLLDHEIPKMMEEINEKEPKVEGPGGSQIGTETGTMTLPKPATSTSSTTSQPAQASGSQIKIHPVGSAGNIASGGSRSTVTTTSNQQSNTGPFGAVSPITEQSIAQVIEFAGCSKQEAVAALQQAGGNVDLALSLLF